MKKLIIVVLALFLVFGCVRTPSSRMSLEANESAVIPVMDEGIPDAVLLQYEELVLTHGKVSLSICPDAQYLLEATNDTGVVTYYYDKAGAVLVSSEDEEPLLAVLEGCVALRGQAQRLSVIGATGTIEDNTTSEDNTTGRRLTGSGRTLRIPGSASSTVRRLTQPCSDSDGGIDLNKRGSVAVATNPFPRTDSCVSPDLIKEYYCQGKKPASLVQQCPNGCSDGACKKAPSSSYPVCTDSDGGRNYDERGTAISTDREESDVQTDSCSGDRVREYYCQSTGRVGTDYHDCEYGCTNGVCNDAPEIVPVSCTDSDGGRVYNTRGTVAQGLSSGIGIVRSDSCIGSFVQELYCGSGYSIEQEVVSCEYGCTSGACNPEPDEEPVCNDSDGGRAFDTLGTVTRTVGDETETRADYCLGNSVREYYCRGNADIASEVYACPYGCTGGVCNEEPEPTCTDTDGGAAYDVRGTVTRTSGDGTETGTDVCVGGQVREYYCISTNIHSTLRTCEFGCSDGRCNDEPAPPASDPTTDSVVNFTSPTGLRKLLIVNDLGTTDIYTNRIVSVRIAQTAGALADMSNEVLQYDTCVNLVAGETFRIISPDPSKRSVDPSTLTDPDTILGFISDDSYRYFTLPDGLAIPYHVRLFYGEWRYDTSLACYRPAYSLVNSCDGSTVLYKSADLYVTRQADGEVVAVKMSGFIPEGDLYGSSLC